MEHWEALKLGGYRFVYDDALFPPGTDSFLLSAYPKLKRRQSVCDLGCGTGLLGLLLLQRQPELQITGIEIEPQAAALAVRAAEENGLQDRLSVLHGDLRRIRSLLPAGRSDLVICNPPYYPADSGRLAADRSIRTARTETEATLDEICAAAAYLLRWDGSFCLVQKPERLADVLCAMRAHAIEPKRLRFVCTLPQRAPSLFLLEGRRGGKPSLTVEAPMILQNADGTPTAEVDRIYFRTQEDLP